MADQGQSMQSSKQSSTSKQTLFSVASFGSSWQQTSDLWVVLNPEQNEWIQKVDSSLNFLIRRTFARFEDPKHREKTFEPLLIAPPAGHPARRVLLVETPDDNGSVKWLKNLDPIVHGLLGAAASPVVTIFAPRGWKAPSARSIIDARNPSATWELRWVE